MTEVERQPTFEEPEAPLRKPYEKPEVVYEARLEVRAGSPLGMPDMFDPLDPGNVLGE